MVLVRHGQTDYNREGRWQGVGSDVALIGFAVSSVSDSEHGGRDPRTAS